MKLMQFQHAQRQVNCKLIETADCEKMQNIVYESYTQVLLKEIVKFHVKGNDKPPQHLSLF